jgi:transposase
MLVVETIARIRREHFSRGKGIKAIARELRVSRKVVRKVIRSGATEFTYQRREQPHPKLGPFIGRLEAMLAENVARPRRERLTLKRLFDLLRREGYQGGYDAVRRLAGRWRREQRGAGGTAFVPLIFPPGDAYQFDWSHELVELGGMPMTVKVAHVRLCHSRAFYLRAYPRETQEMVFDAHTRAFAFFGGTCRRGIYDNLWTPPAAR